MRILIFANHFRLAHAGAENDLVMLAQALVSRGHDIHVLSDSSDPIEAISRHHGLGNVQAVQDQIHPDLTIDWGFFAPADIHRVGGGVHTAFLAYSQQAYSPLIRPFKWAGHLTSRKHRRQIRKEKDIFANPKATYLAISEFVAGQLYDAGIPQKRVQVLYNGVDQNRFRPHQDFQTRNKLRREWNIREESVTFLFIAHNLRLKNLALLRAVFDRLYQQFPKVRLVVVGKRPPCFSAPYLIYFGCMSRIEDCYAAADVLLHPTYYDAFANVVLEAMSCSLAVVASDCTGASELISDGIDGLILPVANRQQAIQQWSAAISRLMSEEEHRKNLGRRAMQTASTNGFRSYVDAFEAAIRLAHACKTS